MKTFAIIVNFKLLLCHTNTTIRHPSTIKLRFEFIVDSRQQIDLDCRTLAHPGVKKIDTNLRGLLRKKGTII